MLDIKVNGTKIEIVVEGNGIDVVAEFIGSFFKLTKHISALAAKEEKRVANIEKEILATVVALYITEETGRNAESIDSVDFTNTLKKLLKMEIDANTLANMLDEPEQEQPDGDPDGEE